MTDQLKVSKQQTTNRTLWCICIIAAILVIDQLVKIYIKTHFYLGESVPVFSWFELRFIQNPGMAFGMELGSKLFLTIFRIVLVVGLTWYLVKIVSRRAFPTGYLVCISLIIAGAVGNIIDCMIYGMIFNNPYPPEVAHFVPWGQGYGTLFHGMVVDMLYFPLFSFVWPSWIPIIGGKLFSFFDPVFNIADSAITVGMLMLIVFYSQYLGSISRISQDHADRLSQKESQKDTLTETADNDKVSAKAANQSSAKETKA